MYGHLFLVARTTNFSFKYVLVLLLKKIKPTGLTIPRHHALHSINFIGGVGIWRVHFRIMNFYDYGLWFKKS